MQARVEDLLPKAMIWFIPVLLSLTVHEWAHAATANALGDDTAARMGRMTFNSAAGPASNIAIALIVALAMGLLLRFEVHSEPAFFLLQSLFGLNIALAIFNLLPIPPLDGSHVLRGLLPTRSAMAYERIFPYAPILLIGVLFFGRGIITWPMIVMQGWMWKITGFVAGLGS